MQSKLMIAATGTVVALGLLAAPVAAQEPDYEAIVRIMRECAKIEDVPARAACYDNTLAAERLIGRSAKAPSGSDRADESAAQTSAPVERAQAATGFGAESVREPAPLRGAEPDEVELVVRQADRLEPGIYALALDDGSTWRFVDAVPQSYDAPRAGSRIELSRASLGSFQMRYANQRPVRIRRLR